MFEEASCGQMAQNCTEFKKQNPPPPPPTQIVCPCSGAFQRRRREQQHVNPQLLPPRALCRAECLNCGLQVGPHMVGLESHQSPCGAAEPRSLKKKTLK